MVRQNEPIFEHKKDEEDSRNFLSFSSAVGNSDFALVPSHPRMVLAIREESLTDLQKRGRKVNNQNE